MQDANTGLYTFIHIMCACIHCHL